MEHRLSFADAIIHSDGILEIITDADMELSETDVKEIQSMVHDQTEASCGILLNNKNSFSLAFEAIQALRKMQNTYAIATLDRSDIGCKMWKLIVPKDSRYLVNTFADRDKALDWLRSQSDAS